MLDLENKTLKSNRLTYRLLIESDKESFKIFNKKSLTEPCGYLPCKTDEEYDKFFSIMVNDKRCIAVLFNDILIGYCHIHKYNSDNVKFVNKNCVGVGFMIGEEYQKQGYGSESLERISDFLLEKFDVVFADVFVENEASRKTVLKCGFKYLENYTIPFEEFGCDKESESYIKRRKRVFKLGILDKYPLACKNLMIEDSPVVGVRLDQVVDGEKLYLALIDTLNKFPLFKTEVIYDKEFQLRENTREVKIFNIDDNQITFTWKNGTNGYPFKLSYFNNQILLRWCHAVTDGRGAQEFLGVLLNKYFGNDVEVKEELSLGLETNYNKDIEAFKEKKQAGGFGLFGLKINKNFNKEVTCHVLKCNTKDVIALSKRANASPATIIPPLFSMAFRQTMKKKKNVKFGIVIDARGPLGLKTMHNCIFTKEITYTDRFDKLDFETTSTIYRAILDLALQRENVIKATSKLVDDVGMLVGGKNKVLNRGLAAVASLFMKTTSTDSTFTYLGRVDYGETVNAHLKEYIFRSWPDFGFSNIAATDLNGTFTMNFTEAYEDKSIVSNLIKIARNLGIEIEEVETFIYNKEKEKE